MGIGQAFSETFGSNSNVQIIHLKLWGNEFGQGAAVAFDALLKDVSLCFLQSSIFRTTL